MEPVEKFIDRGDLEEEYKILLNELSSNIEECVNFGSHMVSWLMEAPNAKEDDLPVTMFLRNILDELDAISILIKYSSIESCNNLLRTVLENFFYVEYILEKDTYNRSMCFLAWNALKTKKFLLKLDGFSQDYMSFKSLWEKDKFLKNKPIIKIANIEDYKKSNGNLLNSELYEPYRVEYERTKAIKNNPEWYTLFDGPRNLESLAQYLNYYSYYEILYRELSAAAHGTDILDKITSIGNNKVALSQIRTPSKNCVIKAILRYKNTIFASCFKPNTYT